MPADASGLPLLVDVAGREVLVVGGGPVAPAKVTALLAAGAQVVVVAPDASATLAQDAAAGRLTWVGRRWQPEDLDGVWLAVAATSDPRINATVVEAASERRCFCVRADDGASGTANLVATVRRGPLLLAVSTSGAAPALARRLRAELELRYGPEWGELAALLGELRRDPQVRAALATVDPDERRRRWRALVPPDTVGARLLEALQLGRSSEAREVAVACLCSSSG